jgi:hypothetical protein
MRARLLSAFLAVVALAVAASGCIAIYPVKNLLNTDPGASGIVFENHLAYELVVNPTSGCLAGSDARGILVPQRSQWVRVYVLAKISPLPPIVPAGLEDLLNRHFDLTVQDGNQTAWLEVHLKANDTQKDILVEGPRPGGWTVTLSYNLCDLDVPGLKIDDQFIVRVTVRQPAGSAP